MNENIFAKERFTESELTEYLIQNGYDVYGDDNGERIPDSCIVIEVALAHGFDIEDRDTDGEFVFIRLGVGTSCEKCKHVAYRFPYPAMYPCNNCSRAGTDLYEPIA